MPVARTFRFLAFPAALLVAAVSTGTGLKPGGLSEFSVDPLAVVAVLSDLKEN